MGDGERRQPLTWVVWPSNLLSTDAMLTWGMMFFSTESWKSGGGGRSRARKRKGEVVVLMSGFQ